ncbi:hypothetical protein [Psychrobacillus glaciei]|nr:hypothetical protein [Psychrobacillus glaciei]
MLKNKKVFFLLLFLTLIFLLSGCNDNAKQNVVNHYLLLQGESETWSLTGYEVMLTPEKFKAGNGVLKMRYEENYLSEYFQFDTHAIINGEDVTVHSISAEYLNSENVGMDITEQHIMGMEMEKRLNANGNPITPKDINVIYMIVKWKDMNKGEYVEERIDLYNSQNKENAFLE